MRLLIIYSLFIIVCFAGTNDICYKDIVNKEIVHEQLENLYFLKVSKDAVITGHNIIDYNGFNNIDRIKTYTTFKINF